MGITDKGMEIVKEGVSIFSTSPLTLALMVMNFALLGFVYWQSLQFNEQRGENIKLFVEQTSKFNDMLSRCIVPPRAGLDQPSAPTSFKVTPPVPFLKPLIGE